MWKIVKFKNVALVSNKKPSMIQSIQEFYSIIQIHERFMFGFSSNDKTYSTHEYESITKKANNNNNNNINNVEDDVFHN